MQFTHANSCSPTTLANLPLTSPHFADNLPSFSSYSIELQCTSGKRALNAGVTRSFRRSSCELRRILPKSSTRTCSPEFERKILANNSPPISKLLLAANNSSPKLAKFAAITFVARQTVKFGDLRRTIGQFANNFVGKTVRRTLVRR